MCATFVSVKKYIHARLSEEDRKALEQLKRATGQSDSEIVRRGLQLVAAEQHRMSALDLAGPSVGRYKKGARDLSSNPRQLDGFGR